MLTAYVQNYEIVRPLRAFPVPPLGNSCSPKGMVLDCVPDAKRPVQVLDIGFGEGSLGEFIKSTPSTQHWSVDGIDGWEVNCNNAALFAGRSYRNVWHGLAQELPSELIASYDLLCLLDVIEHLDPETAKWLLRTLLSSMGENARLFISTPLWFMPQENIHAGDLEEHLIGVPVTSMMALLPLMYSIGNSLVGGFVLSKRSLENIEFFQPTTDKRFNHERGQRLLRAINMPHQEGVLYKCGA